MSVKGSTRLALPIAKAVGAQYSSPSINQAVAAGAVAVPSPSPLIINGVATAAIDVRTMSGTDVVNIINNVSGVTAVIGPDGALLLSGVKSLAGDGNLRAILGI